MLATYGSFLLLLGASVLVGQAILGAAGRASWSPLAPAVGLAALVALAWAAVRLPGEGIAVLAVAALALLASAALVRAHLSLWLAADRRRRAAVPLAVAGLSALAASLPFIVEGRFGILGTGLNPDMSQHLLAADRLAAGASERLLAEGYPLGPHALVVGVSELGPSTVHGFGGLAIAVAVAASLAPLALLGGRAAGWRIAGALTVGFAYLVASFLVQGAFKETLQALFLLTFAIALHEVTRGRPPAPGPPGALRALPLAALAIGSVYAYSFPGLAWLVGAAAAWAAIELGVAIRRGGLEPARRLIRRAAPAAALAVAVVAAAIAPELGRLIEFARFETFDPQGPGLGNLFGRLEPLVALGIWPSGDFRVVPGGGAAPAIVFYAGAGLALAALGFGLWWWLDRQERAVPAALAAAAVIWLYSLIAGTPYQEAKALVIAAPLVALIAVRALVHSAPSPLTLAYIGAAAASSALVLANGPVGPSAHSPALRELQPELGPGSTLVLAPAGMLRSEYGRDYLAWELRGGRVCVAAAGPPSPGRPPRGIARVLVVDGERSSPPFAGVRLERTAAGYALWERTPPASAPGPCPFVSDGARAEPAASGRLDGAE